MKWPWPKHLLYILPMFMTLSLWDLTMDSVSLTFLAFYLPPKYPCTSRDQTISVQTQAFNLFQAPASFLLRYFDILHSLLLSRSKRKLLKVLIPALFVKHQWLNLSALISCSHAKKEIIWSSVNSWHTWSRPFHNHDADSRSHNIQQNRNKTLFNFFNHATTCYLFQRKY